MDRENKTQDELKRNVKEASESAGVVYHVRGMGTTFVAFCAASAAARYAEDDVKGWLETYFEITGEDTQNYIDAIKESNK